ncbi:hypothetical protein E4U24_000128 [Claviceps purpurea]|nr:hypothetical protein E4U24_000128 [Claviceps purpurea]
MVFLHIGDDISRVKYHLSCPRSEVHGDENKMHLSAVSQLFAFVVQAIEGPKPTTERSASGSTHYPPDEVVNEEETSCSGSKTGKELPQNGRLHKRPESRHKMLGDVFNGSHCTHECVRGLAIGGPLDKNCPNVKDHGSKHIDRQKFLRLMREQLKGEKAQAHCKPINASGHIGYLFKIRLLPHGYTLVAKAVGLSDGAPLVLRRA